MAMAKTKVQELKVRYESNGGPIKKGDVQSVGEVLAEIRRKYGTLTPENVLDHVKKTPASPLHKYFEWDEAKAARIYWLERARQIIMCVHIVPAPGRAPMPVRAFVVTGEKQREYIERAQMLSESRPRSYHVVHALDELRSWVRRYSDLDELRGERDAIEKLLDRHHDAAAE